MLNNKKADLRDFSQVGLYVSNIGFTEAVTSLKNAVPIVLKRPFA